ARDGARASRVTSDSIAARCILRSPGARPLEYRRTSGQPSTQPRRTCTDYNPVRMRVFLTGATGYVGAAVAAALHDRGHEITALVRPESDAKELRERGAAIVAGDLATLPSLTATFAGHDSFVHTAFS